MAKFFSHRSPNPKLSSYVDLPSSPYHTMLGTLGEVVGPTQALYTPGGQRIWVASETLKPVQMLSEGWEAEGRYHPGDTVHTRWGPAEVLQGPVQTPMGLVYRLKGQDGHEFDDWEHEFVHNAPMTVASVLPEHWSSFDKLAKARDTIKRAGYERIPFRVYAKDLAAVAQEARDAAYSKLMDWAQKQLDWKAQQGELDPNFSHQKLRKIDTILGMMLGNVKDEAHHLIPYLVKQIRKGQLDLFSINTREQGDHVSDTLNQFAALADVEKRQNRKVPDFNQISLQEMEQWTRDTHAANAEDQWVDSHPVFDAGNGWKIVRVGPEDLAREGEIMSHCVGGYCDAVERGESTIYSLRDPKGEPHVTIEIKGAHGELTDGDRDLNVVQVQGKGNVEPIPEYRKMVDNWFDDLKSKGYSVDSPKSLEDMMEDPHWREEGWENHHVLNSADELEDYHDTMMGIPKETRWGQKERGPHEFAWDEGEFYPEYNPERYEYSRARSVAADPQGMTSAIDGVIDRLEDEPDPQYAQQMARAIWLGVHHTHSEHVTQWGDHMVGQGWQPTRMRNDYSAPYNSETGQYPQIPDQNGHDAANAFIQSLANRAREKAKHSPQGQVINYLSDLLSQWARVEPDDRSDFFPHYDGDGSVDDFSKWMDDQKVNEESPQLPLPGQGMLFNNNPGSSAFGTPGGSVGVGPDGKPIPWKAVPALAGWKSADSTLPERWSTGNPFAPDPDRPYDPDEFRAQMEQHGYNQNRQRMFEQTGITPDQRHNELAVEQEHMPANGSRIIVTAPSGHEFEATMVGSSHEPYTGPKGSTRVWFTDEDGDTRDVLLGRYQIRPAAPLPAPEWTDAPQQVEQLVRNASENPDYSFVYYMGELNLVEWSHTNRHKQLLKDLLNSVNMDTADDFDDNKVAGGTVTNGKVEFEGAIEPETRREAEKAIAEELGSKVDDDSVTDEAVTVNAPEGITVNVTINGWKDA